MQFFKFMQYNGGDKRRRHDLRGPPNYLKLLQMPQPSAWLFC